MMKLETPAFAVALFGSTLLCSPAIAQAVDPAIAIAIAVEPDSLDACDIEAAQNGQITRGNLYETLTRIDADEGTVQPFLATSWKRVDDLTWEFTLKPAVTFHDGTPFNAEVAVANIIRTQAGTEIDGAPAACLNSSLFPEAVDASVVDDMTLRVTTQRPDAILPTRISYVGMGNLESQQTAEKTNSPVGTGPYQFVERVQGQHIKLTRFADYWDEAPQVKDVTYLQRADPAVRAGTVRAGEAQIAVAINPQHATDDDRTVEFRESRLVLYRLRHDKEPFTDKRIRQAVSKAIDRETIVPVLMGRTGTPAYQMLSPLVNGYVPDFDAGAVSFDPEAAKALVEEARADGSNVDAEFLLVTRAGAFPGSDEVVQTIAQSLQGVGLNPRVVSMELTARRAYLRQPFPEDQQSSMLMLTVDNTSGDASFTLPRYITCEGQTSSTCNPEIDRIIEQAYVAEGDERAELYQEAARKLYLEEMTMEGLAEQVQLMVLAPGVEYSPNSLSGVQMLVSDIHVND